MVLVDTSVWVDHFREGVPALADLLERNVVFMHPFVHGELACGNLKSRAETLLLLANLPMAPQASNEEVLEFIEANRLMGKGIGLIDAHLLASVVLAADARLWTHDRRLGGVAKRMKCRYGAPPN
ncbi:MAG: type II toxin-antitoxin system VapC family toxin [Algiphilus sp.]|uniref:type II toxin-antitoxin system VapC family toxin n=1 Tax=Algiphilus sp. TaxID=1872431 RepID=UPI0032F08718